MIFTENELKKWTLKSQKSQIAILPLNQCSISAVCWGPKNRTNWGIPVEPLDTTHFLLFGDF